MSYTASIRRHRRRRSKGRPSSLKKQRKDRARKRRKSVVHLKGGRSKRTSSTSRTINNNRNSSSSSSSSSSSNNRHTIPIKKVYGRIYAEWCGHCKNMVDAWETLKRKMEKEWTCIDIEEKEANHKVPEFNRTYKPKVQLNMAQGFPYIWKLDPTTNEVVDYTGADRTVNGLYTFLIGQH